VKKGITDDDISALATDEANQPAVIWDLTDLQVQSTNQLYPQVDQQIVHGSLAVLH